MDDEIRPGVEASVVRSVMKLPEIQDVVSEVAETAIDELSNNPALEAIPVVKTLRALWKGGLALKEGLLMKKLSEFLLGIGPTGQEDVRRWASRAEENPIEMGERILAVIDKATSRPKARYVGAMFRVYLDGECDGDTFLRAIEMIDAALTEDLSYLMSQPPDGETDSAATTRLTGAGFMVNRSTFLVTQGSRPPALSREGELLRRAVQRPDD